MQINNVLLINPSYYSSKAEDIEYLYNSGNITNLIIAAQKCEKFHSYFHYEESFFYTILSNLVFADQKQKFLEKAVQLSPVNKKALLMLKEINHDKNYELEEKLSYIQTLSNDLSRPYDNFLAYMRFATENPELQKISKIPANNYWFLYEEFCKTQSVDLLESTMDDLKNRHIFYHKEAAQIYYALYLLAWENGLHDLARFAITKARNLNPEISALH